MKQKHAKPTPEELLQYEPLIRSSVMKVAGEQMTNEDIGDMVQTIYLDMLGGKLQNYDPKRGCKFSTYLAMIARRTTVSVLRAQRKTVGLIESTKTDDDHDPNGVVLTSDEGSAFEALVRQEHMQRVRASIEKLPEDCKDVLLAAMDDNFDMATYAKEKGCTYNAVAVRRHRAIKKLRKILAEDDS